MQVAFTKMQLYGPDKKEEKVVVTKICFYGSAKTEQKSVYDGKQEFYYKDGQNQG